MNMIRTKQLFILLILILCNSFTAAAETVYVSDQLRVGVRPEPDNAYAPVGVVKTGMKLEVLDRQQGFRKIKTEDGLTGWIKDIYVVEKPPAIITLQEMQEKQTTLSARVKEMEETISSLEGTNNSLKVQVEELKEERSRLQSLQAKSIANQQQSKSTWYWWLLVLLVVLVGAFAGGVQWNRQQSMKRLGGLRI
ncbi:MAG: TIGR04211 family SH3 domain-containing protein [Gammaproteobacteria bacterium]|jgi:SH3 domain protein